MSIQKRPDLLGPHSIAIPVSSTLASGDERCGSPQDVLSETTETTPRTLVENYMKGHETIQSTRKIQRIEQSPPTKETIQSTGKSTLNESPNQSHQRSVNQSIHKSLRRKATMNNFLVRDSRGPTPRTMIRDFLHEANEETPVPGTQIQQSTSFKDFSDTIFLEKSGHNVSEFDLSTGSFLTGYPSSKGRRKSQRTAKRNRAKAAIDSEAFVEDLDAAQQLGNTVGNYSSMTGSCKKKSKSTKSLDLRYKSSLNLLHSKMQGTDSNQFVVMAEIHAVSDEVSTSISDGNVDSVAEDKRKVKNCASSTKENKAAETELGDEADSSALHPVAQCGQSVCDDVSDHEDISQNENVQEEQIEFVEDIIKQGKQQECNEQTEKSKQEEEVQAKSGTGYTETEKSVFKIDQHQTQNINEHDEVNINVSQELFDEETLQEYHTHVRSHTQSNNLATGNNDALNDSDAENVFPATISDQATSTQIPVDKELQHSLGPMALLDQLATPEMSKSFAQLTQPTKHGEPRKNIKVIPQVEKRSSTSRSRTIKGKSLSAPRFPASLTKSIFQHFCRRKIHKNVMQEVEKVADEFWRNAVSDLSAYCIHAHRIGVEQNDMEMLLARQGFITEDQPLDLLIENYLCLEYREELIPVARSGNVVKPRK